jgi:hypothetical protein
MSLRQRIKALGRLLSFMICLLALAAMILIVGLALQEKGLQAAANVAQLVSVLLAIPPLAVSAGRLVRQRHRALSREIPAPKESSASPESLSPLRITAEVIDTEVLARRGDGEMFPVGGHSLQIYVESVGETVILRGFRPVVVSREMIEAVLAHKPTLGRLQPRPFALLLDRDPPEIEPQDKDAKFPFSVSPSDPEIFKIKVFVKQGQVAWYLLLDWTLKGHNGTYRIDAAGQPFVTVGEEGLRPEAKLTPDGREWL